MLPQPNERRSRGKFHPAFTATSLQLQIPLLLQAQAASYPCRRLDTSPGVAHVPTATHSRPSHQAPSLKKAKIGSVCISQFLTSAVNPDCWSPFHVSETADSGKPSRMALTHSALEQNKTVPPRALHKVGHSSASKDCARAQGRTKP